MLSIVNNAYAVGARNMLGLASAGQAKSIQRLASGLRINSAADDPSGLAISERMRSQINGLGRASLNAQDAISYMQTAEGGLNEQHSVLQRMRELSVQAANGTLTSSDRQTIQGEVDQLKTEVDRIATSTEFNTKKLLNGDASGLWSSSSDGVKAIIRGKVAEGNYKLEIEQTPVENHVLKTDIFSVKDGVQAVKNVDLQGTAAATTAAVFTANDTNLTFKFDDGSEYSFTALASVATSAELFADEVNNNVDLSQYIKATVDTAGAISFVALRDGEYGNSFQVRLTNDTSAATGNLGLTTAWTSFAGGSDSESGISVVSDPVGLISGFEGTSAYTMDVTINNGALTAATSTTLATFAQTTSNGFSSNSTLAGLQVDSSSVSVVEGGAYLMLEVLETKGDDAADTGNAEFVSMRFSFDNGSTWKTMSVDMGEYMDTVAGTGGVELTDGKNSVRISTVDTDYAFNAGDKMLIGLTATRAATDETISMTTPISDGANPPAATQSSRTYSFQDAALDKKAVTLDVVQLETANGNWSVGSISVDFGDEDAATGGIKFDVESGGIASANTELYKLDKFYDTDGNFILGDSGKTLTMYNAEGKSSQIYLDGMDTIGEVAKKLNDAIKDGLGMATGNSEVDSHFASFVSEGIEGTDEAVKGTIVIRSGQMGPKGQLSFSGDEDLINALSLATINDPNLDPMTVKVTDAHSGKVIGEDTISDNVLRGVIKGVDVELDPNADIQVSWDETKKEMKFSTKPGSETQYLHIVDNAKSFQIGANEGQTMESFIGNMSAHAIGADKVLVVSQESAQKSITYVDEAIDRVSSERARIGATVNRLDHTINNLNVQQENAIASESRIRDLDLAKEATEMTKNQILVQAATSMLAQANQMSQGLLGLLR